MITIEHPEEYELDYSYDGLYVFHLPCKTYLTTPNYWYPNLTELLTAIESHKCVI